MSKTNGKTANGYTLSIRSERSLDWFFGLGQSAFEGSIFGAQLEQARSLRYRTERCKRCGGDGFTKSDGQCPKCLGMGRLAYKRRGNGRTPTVYPTAEVKSSGGYSPDERILERYAQVSRTLDRATSLDDCARPVLWCYYGDLGARWARTKHGRIFALYVLTQPAKRLLEIGEQQTADLGIRPDERLGVEAGLQSTQPKTARAELLTRADLDARRLLVRACRAWNQADRPR